MGLEVRNLKCNTCMLTKITKKPFQNVKRETKVLKLIHSDLCDLHDTPSLRNKKYFVAFINDASRFCYVYLLHTKDEASDKFKVFKTEVELQQGSLIKRFRTDWGVAINSIIESMDAIFDEHRFSSVPIPSQRLPLPTGTKISVIRTNEIETSVIGKDSMTIRHRSYTFRKSIAPVRNGILVYPDSDEEDEEYCSLPSLLPCFQTPQPCAIIHSVHHNNHNEVDTDNITIEEYEKYELAMLTKKNGIQVPTQDFTSQFFNQSPNPPLHKKDSLDEILDDLFEIRAENIRNMEHEVPNRCNGITNYEDSDQEDGKLPDLPTFSTTSKFASVCEQGEDNIDVNTAHELEEVQVKEIEMDEDYDIDHSNIKEAIQWSPAQDPFLVFLELDVQSSFLLHTIPSSISNEVKREFKIPHSQAGSHSKEMEFEVTSTRIHVVQNVSV
ncbi:putative reverse transcriptase domain-containing protein [Tanacetum coccineum]